MPDIDWASIHHAYGPASDIPALLASARVAAPPASYRDEPWFTLWSALCHQDDVYPASYAAVPELITVATERGGAVAVEVLFLAASIELHRHEYGAPAVPSSLLGAYGTAIAAARPLAADLATRTPDPDGKLAMTIAVFEGDLAGARALLGEDDEEED